MRSNSTSIPGTANRSENADFMEIFDHCESNTLLHCPSSNRGQREPIASQDKYKTKLESVNSHASSSDSGFGSSALKSECFELTNAERISEVLAVQDIEKSENVVETNAEIDYQTKGMSHDCFDADFEHSKDNANDVYTSDTDSSIGNQAIAEYNESLSEFIDRAFSSSQVQSVNKSKSNKSLYEKKRQTNIKLKPNVETVEDISHEVGDQSTKTGEDLSDKVGELCTNMIIGENIENDINTNLTINANETVSNRKRDVIANTAKVDVQNKILTKLSAKSESKVSRGYRERIMRRKMELLGKVESSDSSSDSDSGKVRNM